MFSKTGLPVHCTVDNHRETHSRCLIHLISTVQLYKWTKFALLSWYAQGFYYSFLSIFVIIMVIYTLVIFGDVMSHLFVPAVGLLPDNLHKPVDFLNNKNCTVLVALGVCQI